jgi:hypothetical protein
MDGRWRLRLPEGNREGPVLRLRRTMIGFVQGQTLLCDGERARSLRRDLPP